MTKKEYDFYNDMINLDIATFAELDLARALMAGSWEEVLNAVLFFRTGLRSYEQLTATLCERENGDEEEY